MASAADELRTLTTRIVKSYVANNPVATTDLPVLISSVYNAFSMPTAHSQSVTEKTPAVPIRKSVSVDSIYCLECGVKRSTMKRHIHDAHGLTPDTYRKKWGLPPEYPLTAPNYSKLRSEYARRSGLGYKKRHRPKDSSTTRRG